jgi:hypothetical protein
MGAPIQRLVLDFDGTCTRVEQVADAYLEAYRDGLARHLPVTEEVWASALERVRSLSPRIGWMVASTPCAPAAADPYILAFEAAHHLRRQNGAHVEIPVNVHADAYAACPAPWRQDVRAVLEAFIGNGTEIWFISNSGTTYIEKRILELIQPGDPLRASVKVQSDAGKFKVCELPWEHDPLLNASGRDLFSRMPAALPSAELGRPIYLKRGSYFHALSRAFGGDFSALSTTLFCGDIWELDLAMPRMLGARVHLLERASPFDTYDYERRALAAEGEWAKRGIELKSLLEWLY